MSGTNHKISQLKSVDPYTALAGGLDPSMAADYIAADVLDDPPAVDTATLCARGFHASGELGHYIVICGGLRLHEQAMNDIWLWHLELRGWQVSKMRLPLPVYGLSLVVRDAPKELILFGGMGAGRPSPQLVFLRSPSNGLSLIEDLCVSDPGISIASPALALHSAFLHHDCMVVFGGIAPTPTKKCIYSDVLHVLDLESHTWTTPTIRGCRPPGRAGHACAVVAGKGGLVAYVFGGYRGTTLLDDLWCLRLDGYEWHRVQCTGVPRTPRVGHSLCSLGTKLLSVGGFDGTSYSSTALLIDLEELHISEMAVCRRPQDGVTSATARFFHTAVAAGQSLIIFGGGMHPSPTLTTVPHVKGDLLQLHLPPSLAPAPATPASAPLDVHLTPCPQTPQPNLKAHRRTLSSPSPGTACHPTVPGDLWPHDAGLPPRSASEAPPADGHRVATTGRTLSESAKILTASLLRCFSPAAAAQLGKQFPTKPPSHTPETPVSPRSADATGEEFPSRPSLPPGREGPAASPSQRLTQSVVAGLSSVAALLPRRPSTPDAAGGSPGLPPALLPPPGPSGEGPRTPDAAAAKDPRPLCSVVSAAVTAAYTALSPLKGPAGPAAPKAATLPGKNPVKRRRHNSPIHATVPRKTATPAKPSPKLGPKAKALPAAAPARRPVPTPLPALVGPPTPLANAVALTPRTPQMAPEGPVSFGVDGSGQPFAIDLAAQPTVPDVSPVDPTLPSRIENRSAYRLNTQDVLGQGSYGKVFAALHTQEGCLLAVKEIPIARTPRQDQDLNSLAREISTLASLKHNNIVCYLGSCVRKNSIHICLEYCSGGALSTVLARYGPLSLTLMKKYGGQILLGLRYLHQNGVLHRDIKGGNILLKDQGQVKLADFGASKRIGEVAKDGIGTLSQGSALKGTPFWMAPEVISKMAYSEASDMWSFGCVMIEMGSARPPWHERNFDNQVAAMFHIATAADLPVAPPCLADPLGSHFLHCCLARTPAARPAADLLLRHPWLTSPSPEPLSSPPLSSPISGHPRQDTLSIASHSTWTLTEGSIYTVPGVARSEACSSTTSGTVTLASTSSIDSSTASLADAEGEALPAGHPGSGTASRSHTPTQVPRRESVAESATGPATPCHEAPSAHGSDAAASPPSTPPHPATLAEAKRSGARTHRTPLKTAKPTAQQPMRSPERSHASHLSSPGQRPTRPPPSSSLRGPLGPGHSPSSLSTAAAVASPFNSLGPAREGADSRRVGRPRSTLKTTHMRTALFPVLPDGPPMPVDNLPGDPGGGGAGPPVPVPTDPHPAPSPPVVPTVDPAPPLSPPPGPEVAAPPRPVPLTDSPAEGGRSVVRLPSGAAEDSLAECPSSPWVEAEAMGPSPSLGVELSFSGSGGTLGPSPSIDSVGRPRAHSEESSEAGGPAFLLSMLAMLLAGRESPGLALLVDLLPGAGTPRAERPLRRRKTPHGDALRPSGSATSLVL